MSKIFTGTNAPKRHQDFTPAKSTDPEWLQKYEKVKKIIDNNGAAVLLGGRGKGKTQAAVSTIGYIKTKGKSAFYTTAFEIFLSIRNGNNPNSNTTEQKEISKYIKPTLLVIDAFEVRAETKFENRVLDHIIDRRYSSQKPTIIISNETPEAFAAAVGESIVDRIAEDGGVVIFESIKSFRRKG